MEEEKKRSGVKAQRRREGMGSAEGGVSGWMWNLRTFWFSMRKRRRAEIHFWGSKVVGGRGAVWEGAGDAGVLGLEAGGCEDSWGGVGTVVFVSVEVVTVEIPMHHFQMRWPLAVGSGVPRMCLH
jgi:hypothetical protein